MKQPYKEGTTVAIAQTGNRLSVVKKYAPEETYKSWYSSGAQKAKTLTDSSKAHSTGIFL